MKITRERIEQIFEETESKWEGDNAFKGLQIISKYTDNIIVGAEHDIIFSMDVDKAIAARITEDDVIELAKLNWMIDEYDEGFACFV